VAFKFVGIPGNSFLPELPAIEFDYGTSPYNYSKVALLIENRPLPMIAPLTLHFMSVVPPEWRFQFMGSNESVDMMKNSAAIMRQVEAGKMDLTYIPSNMTTNGGEAISQFLTTLWVYETLLQPAEWLLVFQTDSILCAHSLDDLDSWLQYDWVGAPWSTEHRYGGNGGLSLRRVSSIIQVLRHQQRLEGSEPEDVWLTERLGHLPNPKVANGTEAQTFSVEGIGSETPMGYHLGGSGAILSGQKWGTLEKRKKIFEYCPEIKMCLSMDVESLMGETCNEEWW